MRLLFCVVLALWPCVVSGFGPLGHQIIGAVADDRLAGTSTGTKIRRHLDGFSLQKASVIPDEIRGWDKDGPDRPGIFHYTSRPRIDAQLTEFWKANPPTDDRPSARPSHGWFHYTDVPLPGASKYGGGTVGRSRWDIVQTMRYCVAVLPGEEPETNERKITKPIAIILLAHFVGDIHQPLHVGARYFNAPGETVDPEKGEHGFETDGGNRILLHGTKLHALWDNNAVKALFPELPASLRKEERRARAEEARKLLVRELLAQEPANWRMPEDVSPGQYPEAWANEILPLARQAHERLRFTHVELVVDEGRTVASVTAEEKEMADGISSDEWSARMVRQQLHTAGWRLAAILEKALP